jgi:hypothetical protein
MQNINDVLDRIESLFESADEHMENAVDAEDREITIAEMGKRIDDLTKIGLSLVELRRYRLWNKRLKKQLDVLFDMVMKETRDCAAWFNQQSH